MTDNRRKCAPRKAAKGEAAEQARRRRQADQLRANLLKRKEQSRSRTGQEEPSGRTGDDPARG